VEETVNDIEKGKQGLGLNTNRWDPVVLKNAAFVKYNFAQLIFLS
jgi:hypothetical protein